MVSFCCSPAYFHCIKNLPQILHIQVSTSITQFTSSIFLLIMSADRYLAVCHPISSPKFRTPFVAKIVAIIAWTTSAVFMLPVMLYSNTIGRSSNEDEKKSCIIKWPHSDSQSQLPFNGTFGLLEELEDTDNSTTFILYSLVMGFAIPLRLGLRFSVKQFSVTFLVLCFFFVV